MENRIPIDELFHDKLSEGGEQMNLGAWANMERMLDGKNPYATEEEKKRRGLFPFFFIFLLGIGITGAGYYMYNKSSHELASAAKTVSTSHNTVAQSFNSPSQTSNSISNNQEQSISEHVASQKVDNQINNTTNSTQSTSVGKSTLIQSTKTSSLNSTRKSSSPLHSSTNSAIAKSNNTFITQKSSDAVNDDQTNSTQQEQRNSPKKYTKASKLNRNQLNDNLEQNQSEAGSQTNSPNSIASKVKEVTTMPAVTIASREKRKNDGSLESILHDTLGTSTYEKVTERNIPEVVTASLDPMVTNPRYKKLSAEEELNAKIQQTEPMRREESIVNATTSQTVESNIEATSSSISINSNQRKSAVQHTGYFEDLKKFFSDTYTKVSNFMLYSPKPNWYTGLNMGVNMSLSNTQNNFGGFQGGFSALTPINDYFSFVTELKFYYRKNGGYTPNDISYNIINQTKDTSSIIHNTIYSYTKDSTVKTYNIKNFYSLELPLMAQLNIRSLAFYGGVNLAYGFKLKTTDKVKNYKIDYEDTIPSSAYFSFPVDKGGIIARDDFSSRFGIGYTIGASYSFSPQLHLDLRVTQNVWDNMKTNAAREISNGYFKVPSIQFALGYRFRKFTPGE